MTESPVAYEQPNQRGNLIVDYLGRQSWLFAAIWLVFLAFTVIDIWDGDSSLMVKVAATALVAAFAGVYTHGFSLLADTDDGSFVRPYMAPGDVDLDDTTTTSRRLGDRLGQHPGSVKHFVALIVLSLTLLLLGGLGTLGTVIYIGAFAMFNLSLLAAGLTFVAVMAISIGGPALAGALDQLWFFAVTTASVSVFCMIVRLTDERHYERQALRTQLAVSDERSRVARDVHDVLGHSLTVVTLKAELCQRLLELSPDDPEALEKCRHELDELTATSRRALAEIRTTVGGLRQTDLGDELAVARSVLADAGVKLTVLGDHSLLSQDQRTVLAWVVRESVTNIIRHAKATTCHLTVNPDADRNSPILRIVDNGIGMDAETKGNGLCGLHDRVVAYGGTLTVRSPGGHGQAPDQPADARPGTTLEVIL